MDLNNVNEVSEKNEPEQLFQDSWFFGNLLQNGTSCSSSNNNKQPKSMLRSFSDPCTSSSSYGSQGILTADKSYEEAYRSIKKLEEEFDRPAGLKKAPSMPSRRNKGKSKKSSSSSTLLRAPSLPACLVERAEEFLQDDEEIEFSMGKLIRQASMKCRGSENFPPRTHGGSKGLTPSSSMSRQRSIKGEVDVVQMEGSEDVIPQVPMKQLQPQKSLTTSLKSEELQGFKDLGFQFEKIDLDPSPSFRERRRTEEKGLRRSYPASEAPWGGHSSAPPVPRRGGKRATSSNDVMKEQIKFWARAVASNVRQEC